MRVFWIKQSCSFRRGRVTINKKVVKTVTMSTIQLTYCFSHCKNQNSKNKLCKARIDALYWDLSVPLAKKITQVKTPFDNLWKKHHLTTRVVKTPFNNSWKIQ
jgi:hypothetical protein